MGAKNDYSKAAETLLKLQAFPERIANLLNANRRGTHFERDAQYDKAIET